MKAAKSLMTAIQLDLSSVAEVAKQLGIKEHAIYQALNVGHITCHKAGGMLLFNNDDVARLETFLGEKKAAGETPAGFLTLKQAAKETCLDTGEIKALIAGGYWEGYKQHPGKSGRWLVSQGSVASYLEHCEKAGFPTVANSPAERRIQGLLERVRATEERIKTLPANSRLPERLYELIAFEWYMETFSKKHAPHKARIDALYHKAVAFYELAETHDAAA